MKTTWAEALGIVLTTMNSTAIARFKDTARLPYLRSDTRPVFATKAGRGRCRFGDKNAGWVVSGGPFEAAVGDQPNQRDDDVEDDGEFGA